MLILAVVIALTIILVILYDILLTILSQQGAGPVTTFWTRYVRKIYLAGLYRSKSGKLRVNLASFVLIFTFFVWYIALFSAWVLLFAAFDQTIQTKGASEAITLRNVVYFIGTTFSTLGPGDYVPTKLPWTLLTSIGAFVASAVMTMSISYLIPVFGGRCRS